jgi:hypothetical protein
MIFDNPEQNERIAMLLKKFDNPNVVVGLLIVEAIQNLSNRISYIESALETIDESIVYHQ